ncbi:MMPL family transporter [Aidingimonas lacisalsi]|uniref:MMPL family transporter n=1 Tax=Aidingimonas lacisalsi TaxID=2604086 RepID=UPI0011D1C8C9|nr:MMPL family transporter [Aidingimonas lacisalsi]
MSTTPEYDKRARQLATLWLLVLLACAIALAWQLRDGLPTDTRLTAMLPEDRQSPLVEQAANQLSTGFEARFVLVLSSPVLKEAATDLARRLENARRGDPDDGRPLLDQLDWRPQDLADDDPRESLDRYRYRLLTPAIREQIDSGDTRQLVTTAMRDLFSPAGTPRPITDPFGLLDTWLNERKGNRMTPHDGLLTVTEDGRRHALLMGRLASHPYDLEAQRALTDTLQAFKDERPDASLMRSGLIFHAAAGAEQAKREITTIGLGALFGLVTILLVVFRSPRVLLHMLLPLGGGLLFALPLTLLIFDRLHLLTLAFGASLIGIAIDYALHLQCDRVAHGARFQLKRLLPGLVLGLVSSLLAYLAQALTPMPGLRQMAVFAALGLLGAWLTVVLWLPRFALPGQPHAARLAEWLWHWTTPRRRLSPRVLILGGGLLVTLVATTLTVNDSLQLLNPSPPALLEEEQDVQRLLGSDTGNRFFLVKASSDNALLTRLDEIGDTLDAWRDSNDALNYDSLANNVPPRSQQRADLQRVRQLYGTPLETLVAQAGLPEDTIERARASLQDAPFLSIHEWLASPLGDLQQRLWLGKTSAGDMAATLVITGTNGSNMDQRLATLADRHPGVTYVNRAKHLSGLLGTWRQHIAGWVALAVAGLVPIMIWRYRRDAWRVLTPPLGAVLGVLSLFAVSGIPLNVFSQLGLLLVLGIGLDAGIFTVEHARRSSTWLAISLSTLSSMLAFGLLSFSATPALHYMGLACLTGLAIVWLLVPWSRPTATVAIREISHAE